MPTEAGFGVPHTELHAACRRLWKDLERAEAAGRQEVVAIREKLHIETEYHDTWEVELYASAIHIFAAMTAEAVMNVYAVVRYGEESFDQHFRYGDPVVRLGRILHYLSDVDLSESSEIVQIVRRLFSVRNELVHAKSAEDFYNENHAARVRRTQLEISKETAKAALADVDRFVALMSQFDPDVAMLVHIW